MKRLTGIASLLLGMATAASAAYTPYNFAFDGASFTFTQTAPDSFTLRIQGPESSTGGWKSAVAMDSFALKAIGSNIMGGEATPGSWATSAFELNANGCLKGESGGVCFDAMTPIAISDDFTLAVDLTFSTGYQLAIGSEGPHLTARFLDAAGNKVGSLLSTDLGSGVCTGSAADCSSLTTPASVGSPAQVPEPGSLALVVAGLFAAGLGGRQLRRQRRGGAPAGRAP